MPGGVTTLHDAPGLRVGQLGDVFVFDLIGAPTLDTVDTLAQVIGGAARTLRKPYALLQVLRAESKPPQGDVLEGLIRITIASGGPLQAFVTLGIGSALRKAIVRSVLAHFALRAPSSLFIDVTSDIEEACRWVCDKVSCAPEDLHPAVTDWASL